MKLLDIIKGTKFTNVDIHNINGSCAMVGNSGVILNNEHGPLIDINDDVIRFNASTTSGFEKYVGKKTTFRIMNCHYILNIESDAYYAQQKQRFPETKRNFLYTLRDENIIFKTDPTWKLWNKRDILNKVEEYNNVFFVSDEFYNLAKKINHGKEASNGFIGLMFALKYYDSIECYGFSFYDKKHKKHYYEKVKYDPTINHNFETEKKIFHLLNKNKIIKLH